MSTVYLAGPITGLKYKESTSWREYVRDNLYSAGIVALSPMRFKSYLDTAGVIRDSYEQEITTPLSTGRGIMTRDYFDCMRADLILANLLGMEKPSLGTVMEIAWAFQSHKPVVAVMEPEGNPMDHAMIREAIGFRVQTVADAIDTVKAILSF